MCKEYSGTNPDGRIIIYWSLALLIRRWIVFGWKYAQTLLAGAIICTGKRSLSSALHAMELAH